MSDEVLQFYYHVVLKSISRKDTVLVEKKTHEGMSLECSASHSFPTLLVFLILFTHLNLLLIWSEHTYHCGV